jgi:hypothetical protein
MWRYLSTFILVLAMLWIVPHTLGRWSHTDQAKTIVPSSIFTDFNYSFLQKSADENRIDLIKLTIEHYNPRLDKTTQQQIIAEILKGSAENSLDPFLVTAVIAAESSFRPMAKSPCGARGLMQLTRIVLPSLGVTDPYNIEQNIQGGCRFLGELYQRFGNTTLALAAYNAGPTRVARLGRVPHIRETQNYVRKVQSISTILFEHFLAALDVQTINPIAYIASLSAREHQPAWIQPFHDPINPMRVMANPITLQQISGYPHISAHIRIANINYSLLAKRFFTQFDPIEPFGLNVNKA